MVTLRPYNVRMTNNCTRISTNDQTTNRQMIYGPPRSVCKGLVAC